ncbi:DUF5702 domain-containing protein [Oceanobacillus picturae]|uniref:DUF5702 domain-containing protein n=1 Tax=Oceanobacillus picturae TaxID=171693 RepID=UPI0036289D37
MKKGIKKFIHKFIMDDKGAVSIYLIIITLLLFLFNAVLIDYARILVAERQTEQAAKVALRSTMSSYNQGLQDKGLFAFDGDQGQSSELFKKVFAKNLEPGDGEGFKFVDVQPEESEITTELNLNRSLANKDVFKNQVLEEMKYKAPIEIGESIIESFLALSDDMEEVSVYTDVIKDIEGDVDDREQNLDDLEASLKSAKEKLDSIQSKIHSESRTAYPAVNNLEDLYWGHLEYIKAYPKDPPKEDDEEKTDEEKEKEKEDKEEADKYHKNALELLNDIIPIAKEAKEDLDQALELLGEAKENNDSISRKISEAKDSKGDIYDNAQGENNSDLDTGGDLSEATGSLDDYVLDEGLFTDVEDEIQKGIDSLSKQSRSDALIPKLEEVKSAVQNDFKNRNKNGIKSDLVNSRTYHETSIEHIQNAIDLLENGRSEFKDDELEEENDRADDELGDVKDQMDEWTGAYKEITGDADTYIELSELVLIYEGAIQSNGESFELEDKDDTADQAMNFIDTMFQNIGEQLINGRDELYFNEYILTRFSSHTFPTGGTSGYTFDNNQVEYILYGFDSFGANYMAALSEIFAVRFAINFVDALKRPRSKVFGPYFWVAALGDAFMQTSDDMYYITQGTTISLIPGKNKPQISYKDHLRLFLLAHPEGKTTERVMAVIDNDTGTDLRTASTYTTATAKSSVNLWFLPGLTKMLGEADILEGNVEGNKFIIEKEINYSY